VPAAQAKVVVEASVEGRASGGFRVEIQLLRDGATIGQREIESPDPACGDVVEKAVLAIALMIDPETPLTAPPPPTPPREASPPPEPPPPAAAAEPSDRGGAPAPSPWQGDLELAFGIYAGLLPDVAPGAFVRGRAIPPRLPFAVELEGGYLPEQSVEALPGKGGRFTLFFAGASLCSRPPRDSRLAGSGCAGMRLGSMVGRGYGFDISPKFQSWVPTLAARGRLWFRPLRGLAVLVGPDFLVPLKRDQFTTRVSGQTTPLFRMSPVAVGFELGAAWEL